MPPLPIHMICPSPLRINGIKIYHSKGHSILPAIGHNLKILTIIRIQQKRCASFRITDSEKTLRSLDAPTDCRYTLTIYLITIESFLKSRNNQFKDCFKISFKMFFLNLS